VEEVKDIQNRRKRINNISATEIKMKPAAILMGDSHIRETVPLCRIDDSLKAQAEKTRFVSDIQKKYNIPTFHSGDLLDKWKVNPWLESWMLDNLPKRMFITPGNHDLKHHNLDLLEETSINLLEKAGKIKILKKGQSQCFYFENPSLVNFINCLCLKSFPYGVNPEKIEPSTNTRSIALIHIFTHINETWPDPSVLNAKQLLRKMKGFDLVVTGDNHKPFVVEEEGRLLVNPGSLMRMTVDQIDHKPRIYLYYAENNTVEPIYLPIEDDVINNEHIEIKKKKDARIEAVTEKLKNQQEIKLDFKENLKTYFRENKTRGNIEKITWWSLDR